LGLELSDPGFDYSLLSEFRQRLLEGGQEQELLDTLLAACQQRGWLKARGRQRTDSTHVLAAVRQLNRLELVGETMRQALNELAKVSPTGYERWPHLNGSAAIVSDLTVCVYLKSRPSANN